MANPVKCQKCPEKGEKETMLKVGQKYYHHDCYERWQLEKSKVKCACCKNKDIKSEMTVDAGKYYHPNCLLLVEEEKRYKKELEELLLRTYDFILLPKEFLITLAVFMKKNNVSSKLIFIAYSKATPEIRWSLDNVPFQSDIRKLMYGFKIMQSKINEVHIEEKQKEQNSIIVERALHSQEERSTHNDTVVIAKRTQSDDDLDISNYL